MQSQANTVAPTYEKDIDNTSLSYKELLSVFRDNCLGDRTITPLKVELRLVFSVCWQIIQNTTLILSDVF